MTWIDLTTKVAVVTGGGAGIGRGIALGLAAVGAHVVVLDRNEAGSAVVTEIREKGGRAKFLVCDVASNESVARVAGQVAAEVGPPRDPHQQCRHDVAGRPRCDEPDGLGTDPVAESHRLSAVRAGVRCTDA